MFIMTYILKYLDGLFLTVQLIITKIYASPVLAVFRKTIDRYLVLLWMRVRLSAFSGAPSRIFCDLLRCVWQFDLAHCKSF